MSSVSIAGDTSGSILLQAPAIAGSPTLTLPTTTGTLALTSGGPAFSAYASTGQAISGGTWTKITQDTEEFDTNNNFASSRFTPTVAGYYQVNAGSNTPAANYALAGIYKNGSLYKGGNNGSGAVNSSCVNTLVYLNGTTDYVEFWFVNGSSVTLGSGIYNCYFNGCFLRGA